MYEYFVFFCTKLAWILIICDFLATVCTDKGAQGTWCITSAVTCDEVNKVHKGFTKYLKNYYI